MKPVIAHYQSTWLKVTENWIATQVDAAVGYDSIVLAKHVRNRSQFGREGIYALADRRLIERQYNRVFWKVRGYAPYFANACGEHDVKAIHAWFGYSGLAMLGLARRLDVPLVTSFLGSDFTRGRLSQLQARYAPLFEQGARFLAEGPAAAQRLAEIGAPPARVRVMRLAVDAARIRPCTRSRAPHEPLRVLMAARFTEKKGFPYAVEAFCRFIAGGRAGHLTIVGGGDDVEGQRIAVELRRQIARYDCEAAVTMAGWRTPDELRALFVQHHVFLHPSVVAANGDAEGGHPVVLTEVAASGMPVIATRHCDIPSIVLEGESGWLARERDVDGLLAALNEAFDDPALLVRFGRNARAHVLAHYDCSAPGLAAVYADLLSN